MRWYLSVLVLMLATGACVMDADPTAQGDPGQADTTTTTTTAVARQYRIDPTTDATEPAYVDGVQCKLVFPGALTPDTELYAIWSLGPDGVIYEGDDPTKYNTDDTPNLYAVFGTNPLPSEIHHVDGYDVYDHYHVLDYNHDHGHGHGHCDGADHVDHNVRVKNTRWDVLVLVPGPNYDPATYVSAKSVDELMAQSAAGVLSQVSTPAIFGLPGAVVYSPVVCPGPSHTW